MTSLLTASPAASMPPSIHRFFGKRPDCHLFDAPFLTPVPGFWETCGDQWRNPILALFESNSRTRGLLYPGREDSVFTAACTREHLYKFDVDRDSFFDKLYYSATGHELLDSLARGFTNGSSAREETTIKFWAECSRTNLNGTRAFLEGSEQSRAILFVRNGLDAGLEMLERGCSWKEACKIWIVETCMVEEIAQLYPSRCLLLKYEDALLAPGKTFRSISEFLELAPLPGSKVKPNEPLRFTKTDLDSIAGRLRRRTTPDPRTVEDLRQEPQLPPHTINGWKNSLSEEFVEFFLSMRTIEGTLPGSGITIPSKEAAELMARWNYLPARRPIRKTKLPEKDQKSSTKEGKATSKFAKSGGTTLRLNLKNKLALRAEALKIKFLLKQRSPISVMPGSEKTTRPASGASTDIQPGLVIEPDKFAEGYDVACVIAFSGRAWALRQAVKHAVEQPGGIRACAALVASTQEDWEVAQQLRDEFGHVKCVTHQNQPLGAKWAAGVSLAKSLDPKSIMIMGSDDVASNSFISTAFEMTAKGEGSPAGGFDMVGARCWYLYDNTTHDTFGSRLWRLQYKPEVEINLGAGRLYSRRLLDLLGWEIFERENSVGLDRLGYKKSIDCGAAIGEVDHSDACVLSIKGAWSALNDTDKILNARTILWQTLDFQKNAFFKKYFDTDESAYRQNTGSNHGEESD